MLVWSPLCLWGSLNESKLRNDQHCFGAGILPAITDQCLKLGSSELLVTASCGFEPFIPDTKRPEFICLVYWAGFVDVFTLEHLFKFGYFFNYYLLRYEINKKRSPWREDFTWLVYRLNPLCVLMAWDIFISVKFLLFRHHDWLYKSTPIKKIVEISHRRATFIIVYYCLI